MDDPVLVDVTRGRRVESVHRGAVSVVDADGRAVLALGDVARPVFPRSAVKVIQALPLVESGAADAYSLDDAALSLACASHGGEAMHAETSARMLAAAGRDVHALECGAHWPSYVPAAHRLAAEGRAPSALHNNCSGKHAGFVCLACHLGVEPRGYIKPEHRVQREVKAAIEDVTGTRLEDADAGTDGCSIPTFAVPLERIARGFARLGTGLGLGPARAEAAARLRRAVAARPDMVAGTGRFCTEVMALLGERAFVKTGAEGVYTAVLPERGLGVAVKCDDGGTRAAETIMAALIARYVAMSEAESRAFEKWRRPALVNWNGIAVGAVRPSETLEAALKSA